MAKSLGPLEQILDVGPGGGTYYDLLHPLPPATMTDGLFPGSELELDVLTLIARLRQIDREDQPTHWLWTDRVMGCDVPRLRSHLSAEVIAWEKTHG